jgi:5-methyltetrahydropteroyltriglutamate--homocysteine methyltransferase
VTRVLTTHVGSLPRPQDVVDLIWAEDQGRAVDSNEYDRVIGEAVRDRVARQVEAGIDLVSDGEMGKIGYATYIRHRLSGFELGDVPRATPADLDAYPRYRDRLAEGPAGYTYRRPICRGPIDYDHPEPLERDLRHLRAALEDQSVGGAFMNAPSPGIVALFAPNEHYDTLDEYLTAIGEAMKIEYEAIVAAGLSLQIDAPDLAMGRHIMYRDNSNEEFVASAVRHVEAINVALRDIPAEKVRLHICWGNYEGPHHLDIELRWIIDAVLRAKPQTILFEAANPRHQHEWSVWRDATIPGDKILCPGMIDSTSNYIEHPELIAQRIRTFADLVGPERVIAGTDCGFGTWAGFGAVDPDITWAKFRSLSEGARLASDGRGGRPTTS